MNLVSAPWIPVVMQDGTHRKVSLDTVFREGESIADLAANPCQRIAMTRLLICVAQAALDGPVDEADWLACRQRLADAALAYLEKWRHRFNLFGEHAFLQVDGIDPSPNALADKLDLTLACGNNPTLFDHAATPEGRLFSDASLTSNFLVFQMFSPGGLIGVSSWEGNSTEKTSEHSPCLEGSMLHTFLRGDLLLDTIHFNLQTRAQIQNLANMSWGCPFWELDRYGKAQLDVNASSYLGRLVSVPRAVRLLERSHQVVLAAGTRYAKLPLNREPAGTLVEVGSGTGKHISYLSVNPEKHLWRELPSVLAVHQADYPGGALCLVHLRTAGKATFDIWTGGLAADKAKLVDMAEWNMTLPAELLDTTVLARYQEGVAQANGAHGTLVYAIKTYSELQKADPVWRNKADQLFWSLLDASSGILVSCALEGDPQIQAQWMPVIHRSLLAAYSQSCPHTTPRQIQAYAQGLKILDSWKEK